VVQQIVGWVLVSLALLLTGFVVLGSLESEMGYVVVALGLASSGTGWILTTSSRDRDTR